MDINEGLLDPSILRPTFHKYLKIERVGARPTTLLLDRPDDTLFVEEKIDGANFRFLVKEDLRIIFGSHNQSIGDSTMQINGNFGRAVAYILDRLNGRDLTKYIGYEFFGEATIPHSICYDFISIIPFIGFDIMFNGQYIPYAQKKEIFEELGFQIVPLLYTITAAEFQLKALTDLDVPKSQYGDTQAEGLVVKNYRTQTFLKYVTTRFKEVNRLKFGGSGGQTPINDNEKLVNTYCSNPRIDKAIYSLVNDGEELAMPLMVKLPKMIWLDMIEENWFEILNENWVLDLKSCRKLVAIRCRVVLESAIARAYVQSLPAASA